MKRIIILGVFSLALFLSWVPSAFAVDGFYLGGQSGFVGLTKSKYDHTYNNALGFGIDLGFRANPYLDVLFSSQYSSHSATPNGLSIYTEMLTANIHVLEVNDFDLMLNGGPGFYILSTGGVSDTKFGLHVGFAGDVMATESLRLGIGWNWHMPFDANNFWTVMMRVGYFFGN